MTDWDEFAAGLAAELTMLPAGALVIIETTSSAPHSGLAQFAQTEDMLRAELGAAGQLDPAAGLGTPGNQRAITAGWQIPDEYEDPNWWIELPWPLTSASYRELATMVVIGLRDAALVTAPGDLVYQAWNSRDGNRHLELPLLGIPRQ
ncbi:hypothetical protein ABIA39_001630 [Nocardia sp. GAS34]|uniref:TY-Chap domain-containing protein n=1 Tax=unclassified Nocardia TaxID=2637762 RepID=UPI003D1A2B3F